jgi:hypothetical protein
VSTIIRGDDSEKKRKEALRKTINALIHNKRSWTKVKGKNGYYENSPYLVVIGWFGVRIHTTHCSDGHEFGLQTKKQFKSLINNIPHLST